MYFRRFCQLFGVAESQVRQSYQSYQLSDAYILYFWQSSWEAPRLEHRQQLLDILHISHMWEIVPGIDFAARELLGFDLQPAHRLYLARRYGLVDWIPAAVRVLLSTPLERYHDGVEIPFDVELYMLIAKAKESIALERRRVGNFPPFPKDFDNGPFCDQHSQCKKVWTEKWFFIISRQIHQITEPLALSHIPVALDKIDYRGMNPDCQKSILDWLKEGGAFQLQKEEQLIQGAINAVCTLFM